jgi:transcriptional regulator with XRE-family HTH domain
LSNQQDKNIQLNWKSKINGEIITSKMELFERIKTYRKQRGLTQQALADAIGVKSTALSNWENGTAKPDIETVIALSNFFGVSLDTLVLGKEYIQIDKTTLLATEPQNTYISKEEQGSYIPITDITAAAGNGFINGDNITTLDQIQLPQHLLKNGTYIAVKIKGESMSPTLQDGGFLIIRLLERNEWPHMPNEHIFVICDKEGKTFAKRVKNRYQKGFYVLMSDNPDKASFANFNLEIEEVNSIWHAEWYLSARMPNIHDQYYSRLQRLEDNVDELLKRMK